MAMNIIKSFDSVNRLYRKGVNICKGCERENNGSCRREHFASATHKLPGILRLSRE